MDYIQLEQKWANDMVEDHDEAWLADFLIGNPDPTYSMLQHCSSTNLIKVLRSLCLGIQTCDDDLANEAIAITLSGLESRHSDSPDHHPLLVDSLVRLIRSLPMA